MHEVTLPLSDLLYIAVLAGLGLLVLGWVAGAVEHRYGGGHAEWLNPPADGGQQ